MTDDPFDIVYEALDTHLTDANVCHEDVALEIIGDLTDAGHLPHREPLAEGREHLTASGRLQSDRYPSVPAGKIPLSDRDPQALAPLLLYAALHRAAGKHGDTQFNGDVVDALIAQHGARKIADAVHPLLYAESLRLDKAALWALRDFSLRAERAVEGGDR